MYPLLLTISFILHLFAFFWIFLLSLRLKAANENETKESEIQKEIEDMFQAYLLEMKEENEKLMNMLEKSTKDKISEVTEVKQAISKHDEDKPTQTISAYAAPVGFRSKPKDYVPPLPMGEERIEQSLASQVLFLREKGLKPDEIAQKLNKGKAEIELLLKFNSQKHN
ncbi:coupling factor for flagellin transcription and translation [Schinkia sp. CFF1]